MANAYEDGAEVSDLVVERVWHRFVTLIQYFEILKMT
jgi:hypothetical protein